MARDLVARSGHLGALERGQIDTAAQFIAASAQRIESAAAARETEGVLREVARGRGRITALEDLLREADD